MRRHHNPEGTGRVVVEELPTYDYNRVVFTEEMRKTYKILVTTNVTHCILASIRSSSQNEGYDFEMLPAPTRDDIEVGLKYINNDACYPAIIVVGQLMSALLSGKYDIDKQLLSSLRQWWLSKCYQLYRFLRKALIDAGMETSTYSIS